MSTVGAKARHLSAHVITEQCAVSERYGGRVIDNETSIVTAVN